MISEEEVISLHCLLWFFRLLVCPVGPTPTLSPPPQLMTVFTVLAADTFISMCATKAFVVILDIFELHYCGWLSPLFVLRLW